MVAPKKYRFGQEFLIILQGSAGDFLAPIGQMDGCVVAVGFQVHHILNIQE